MEVAATIPSGSEDHAVRSTSGSGTRASTTSRRDGGAVHARNRERYRGPIGAKYRYSDELSATIRLASGNPDDPISTNQTFTGDFTRKNINLDWAYITRHARKDVRHPAGPRLPHRWQVRRAAVPGRRDDLGRRPLGRGLQRDLPGPGRAGRGARPGKRLRRSSGRSTRWPTTQDGYIFGGQVNPLMHFGAVQLEGGVAQWWYLNPNFIAQALNTNSSGCSTRTW